MAEKIEELLERVEFKTRELANRARSLTRDARTEGERDFAIAMIRESESAVVFWVDQLVGEVSR